MIDWDGNALAQNAVKLMHFPEDLEGEWTPCQADTDGDCRWSGCPQLRDAEPEWSSRHCPLDIKYRHKFADDDEQFFAECQVCNGSGLYIGRKDAPNEASVCEGCDGVGGLYSDRGKVFVGRQHRIGITKVRIGDSWMAYEDFKNTYAVTRGVVVHSATISLDEATRRDAVNATKKKLGIE